MVGRDGEGWGGEGWGVRQELLGPEGRLGWTGQGKLPWGRTGQGREGQGREGQGRLLG